MRRKKFQRIYKKVTGPCYFCQHGLEPVYKDIVTLKRFLSSRGKILAKDKTGVCAKHQRKLSRAIKQARIVALI